MLHGTIHYKDDSVLFQCSISFALSLQLAVTLTQRYQTGDSRSSTCHLLQADVENGTPLDYRAFSDWVEHRLCRTHVHQKLRTEMDLYLTNLESLSKQNITLDRSASMLQADPRPATNSASLHGLDSVDLKSFRIALMNNVAERIDNKLSVTTKEQNNEFERVLDRIEKLVDGLQNASKTQ